MTVCRGHEAATSPVLRNRKRSIRLDAHAGSAERIDSNEEARNSSPPPNDRSPSMDRLSTICSSACSWLSE